MDKINNYIKDSKEWVTKYKADDNDTMSSTFKKLTRKAKNIANVKV